MLTSEEVNGNDNFFGYSTTLLLSKHCLNHLFQYTLRKKYYLGANPTPLVLKVHGPKAMVPHSQSSLREIQSLKQPSLETISVISYEVY